MKKIKVIEEGILEKTEMTNITGGIIMQCGPWAFFICNTKKANYNSCIDTDYVVSCPKYGSCTWIRFIVCEPYNGPKGPGGIINAMRNDQD